ncbi:hypothetical protein BAY61_32420 (plasmid) [Prauserella marina]|uniref:Uncharacterized protein n=1 Tax=Prauserella marina TaxID=530584 RepID=A0A222W1C3_9PSEU|nr:hypothetical protein [Prauserella marina]ASR39987.1 hypothetical protein BAY61_32420 [Prauserella marina]PWV71327.1 hypothetical protein DES30_11243 [Prauserella marina]SDD96475.1 hypothetical protein SAMN05421630_11569 [Prauserella marina]
MTSENDWLDYLGDGLAGQAVADYDRAVAGSSAADAATAEMATPVFDATVAAVLTDTEAASVDDAVAVDEEPAWGDQCYGDAPPERGIDPESREGAEIMRLFRWIKDVEVDDGMNSWPGGDVVERLCAWFLSLGIDPDEHPMDAGQRLALAARAHLSQSLRAADYTVAIGTENRDAEQILTTTLETLADQLGPGSGVHLHSRDGELAHFERPATPLTSN